MFFIEPSQNTNNVGTSSVKVSYLEWSEKSPEVLPETIYAYDNTTYLGFYSPYLYSLRYKWNSYSIMDHSPRVIND